MKLDDGIDKEDVEEAKDSARSYGRYGALGIQMVVIILVFAWGGHWLDGRLELKTPWSTLLGALIGIFGALWTLFKETRKGMK
jgi:heme/copper-type cytochrome/quinol oxidase subunit 4